MANLLLLGDDPQPVLEGAVDAIGFDCETTGLKWPDKVIGMSLAWGERETMQSCYLLDPAGTEQLPMWGVSKIMDSSDFVKAIPKIRAVAMANHPFDYRFLMKQYGFPPLPNIIEIQHVARHLGPQPMGVSLTALTGRYVGPTKKEYAAMKGKRAVLSKMDAESVAIYAREDAEATLKVYQAFKNQPNLSLYKRNHQWDQDFMRLVMEMVQKGLPLDLAHIEERTTQYRRRMIALGQRLVSQGISNPNLASDVMGFAKAHNIPIADTQAETLEQYVNDYPELAGTVEYRQLSKALGSWLEDFMAYGKWDGCLHSRLNPFGTRSYRMSAEDPNAQGIPMEERGDKAFGSMFGVFKSADPEQELWGLDVKQAELRLAATLAQDSHLLGAVSDPESDPYINLSNLIWGVTDKRQLAKRGMLSAIYEVGVTKFAKTCNITEPEAFTILKTIRGRFPKAMATAKAMARITERTGRVDLVTGRPRWLQADEMGHEYKAFNQFVQGTLAELMREAMLRVDQALPGKTVLQVHDSIVLYLSIDEKVRNKQVATIQDCLTGAVTDILKDYVPAVFPIEPKPYQFVKKN